MLPLLGDGPLGRNWFCGGVCGEGGAGRNGLSFSLDPFIPFLAVQARKTRLCSQLCKPWSESAPPFLVVFLEAGSFGGILQSVTMIFLEIWLSFRCSC